MSLLMNMDELVAATVETTKGKKAKPAPPIFAELNAALKEHGKAAVPAALWTTKVANRYRREFKVGNPGFACSVVKRVAADGTIKGFIVSKVKIEA